jgi:hypothetical protein
VASATTVLRTVFGRLGDWLEPSARNSNRLPVKANGLVRLRSPESLGNGGRTGLPRAIIWSAVLEPTSPFSIDS